MTSYLDRLKAPLPAQTGGLTSLLGGAAPVPSPAAEKALATPVYVPKALRSARIVMVWDATASRADSIEEAGKIATRMVREANAQTDLLSLRIIHHHGQQICRAFPRNGYSGNADAIAQHVRNISCIGGSTQIVRAVTMALDTQPFANVILPIGDHWETSDDPENKLRAVAQRARKVGIPLMCYHEGDNAEGYKAYALLAELSGGVILPFGAKLDLSGYMEVVTLKASGDAEALKAIASNATRPEEQRLLARKLLALPTVKAAP